MFYRKEVLEHSSQSTAIGVVLLRSPRLVWALVSLSVAFTVAVIALLVLVDYTKHISTSGSLQPDKGLAQVTVFQAGIVSSRKVQEGQHVQRGQVLFSISGERVTKLGESAAASINSLHQRQQNYQVELDNLNRLDREQREALQQRLHDLQVQRTELLREQDFQTRRVESAKALLARYQLLAKSGFAPALQVQEKSDGLLDQQSHLSNLERSGIDLQSQINSVRADILAQPRKNATQRADVERSLFSLQQDISETETHREIVIVAPISGVVTAIQATDGQAVASGQTLAAIVPEHSYLQAWFYAPSSAIGFVKVGQRVQLRYAAFPYQKFGQYDGTVIEVARSAQPIAGVTESRLATYEPQYKVTVRPDKQTVLAYGRQEPLQPDMKVEGDVLADRRKIIEWIFEPLLAIKGKF
ncbi:HlyD family efflux transporter periplasmic adaptor subunit [Chromobacterium sp. TRC.1.1.SA]|uniref:HlyD family efflux transporter periplasmic adaptor subunit n=1 Tax=Chromobacterium indicum TaxID=3110228 RepID=A0ABV0CKN7_9NEIS